MKPEVLHNGQRVHDGTAHSRALHYGDGVFRTMLWHSGSVVDWHRHLDKLASDCVQLAIDMPETATLEAERDRLASEAGLTQSDPAIIKLIVSRAGRGRGYRSAETGSERWMFAYPWTAPSPESYASGIKLALSPLRCGTQPLLAGAKHLNRLEQVLVSRHWPMDADEVLMADEDGHWIGGTRSNLFCVHDGRVLTPSLRRCGVSGVMRAKVLQACTETGIPSEETRIDTALLRSSDEVFVCNAVLGLWPVRRMDATIWRAPGVLTRRLIRAIRHPFPQDLF